MQRHIDSATSVIEAKTLRHFSQKDSLRIHRETPQASGSLARLLRQVDAPLSGTVLNSASADDTFSTEPYRYESTAARPQRRGRNGQPEHAGNGRRWDDEGDPDAEWDPVGPPARG